MSGATAWTSQLWLDTFGQLLNDGQLYHEDRWSLNFNYNSLTEKVTKEERKRGWKVYNHCAFGNFRCESCPNTWPSARVVVLFRYRLGEDRGTVIMRPFRQMCRDCDNNGFRLPGFSNVEVERALSRLFSRIRRNCYGEDDDSDHGSADSHVITKPHEKSLCEACTMGICSQDED